MQAKQDAILPWKADNLNHLLMYLSLFSSLTSPP